jgi:kynureninase
MNLRFFGDETKTLSELMVSDPGQFMAVISRNPDYLSRDFARKLDKLDNELTHTNKLFAIDEVYPFAGHSLGPVFIPVKENINATIDLQKRLHDGHFKHSHPDGQANGHWFDCDRHQPSLNAVKQLLGFKNDDEFVFTANGLSDNLGKLLDTFFRLGEEDWKRGKTKIAMLATDFFSDQATIVSVVKRQIATAVKYEQFDSGNIIHPQSMILKIRADKNGIYHTEKLIEEIRKHAEELQIICLSEVVFNTGQRLDLHKIFTELKEVIEENHIMIGLDLAHTVGNRAINLSGFPVRIDFAVGCAYKHLCGPPGSSFGIYVNEKLDLKNYPPIQGWKSADSAKVFATINQYDESIMAQSGAVAFRTSNPPPLALIPAQTFLTYFGKIGFDKCFNKSECLTQYLLAQLSLHLSNHIEFITPLDPAQRGAMIVFRIKGLDDINIIEEKLKTPDAFRYGYEVDTRAPNNMRLTAHYAYTTFEQIAAMVQKLRLVIHLELQQKQTCGCHFGMRSKL